MDNPKAGTI